MSLSRFYVQRREGFLNKFGLFFLGKGVVGAVNFALIPVYALLLEPAEFGMLALSMISIQMSVSFLKLGQEAAFSIRFYKYSLRERATSLYYILSSYIVVVGIFYIILNIFLDDLVFVFGEVVSTEFTRYLAFLILVQLYVEFFFNLLKMEQKAEKYALITVFYSVFRSLLTLGFVYWSVDAVHAYVWAGCLVGGVLLLISLAYCAINYPIKFWAQNNKEYISLIKLGIPVIPGMVFSQVLASGDQYFLKYFGLLEALGVYALAYRFAGFFSTFLIEPFKYALVPIAMKKGNDSLEVFSKFMKSILECYVVMVLVCILFSYTIFDVVFYSLIDPSYHSGFDVILLVIVGLAFWGAAAVVSNVIIIKEKTTWAMVMTAAAAILNMILNLVMIPKYGLWGAAAATLISYILVSILYFILCQRTIYILYPWGKLLSQVTISSIALLLMWSGSLWVASVALLVGGRLALFLLVVVIFYRMGWFSPLIKLRYEYA